MTHTPRRRVSRGVREGGQFAEEPRAETSVSLVGSVALADDPAEDQPVIPALKELDTEEMVRAALMSARHQARVKGLRYTSPEDIMQSTMETVLRARKRNPGQVVTAAYISQITSGHVAIAMRGKLRPEDHKAIGIYTRRVAELEAELGRKTSGVERKALAKQIRDEWPDPRHKPSENFVELAEMRFVSLDRTVGDGEQTLGEIVAEQHGATDDDMAVDEDSKLGRALIAATAKGTRGAGKAEARREAWSAIAEVAGVRDAVPGCLSRSQAKAHRDAIAAAGGVRAAISEWNRNEDTAATRALFAPFGETSADDKDDIAHVLVSHSAYADDLYEAALRCATR